MKKILVCLLIILALLFVFASCNDRGTKETNGDTEKSTETMIETEKPKEVEKPEETAKPTEPEKSTDKSVKPEPPHIHEYGEWVVTKEATCTKDGSKYQKCSCGDKKMETIPASHTLTKYKAKAPTCAEIGWDAYEECSRCDYRTYKEKAKLSHNFIERKCSFCEDILESDGLEFDSNGNGTCYVIGIGTCGYKNVKIPFTSPSGDLVIGISPSAFYGCDRLENIIIPDQITIIGEEAFRDCSELMNVAIGNGVKSIGKNAFYKCSKLKSITILGTVTAIGESAFYDCNGLTEVHISDIASWCKVNFKLTENYNPYSNPLYYAGNLYLGEALITDLVIPDGITSIKNYAFYNCHSITSITIPNGVTSIGECAFYACYGLTSITIPNSITSIDGLAFQGCYKLVEVINYSSLIITAGSSNYGNIAGNAKEVHEGKSKIVTKEGYLFYTHGGANYFLGYKGMDTALVLPENYNGENYEIYQRAFFYNDKITSVNIPNSVTRIGERAFYHSNLATITIGSGVTKIGKNAFYNCDGLTEVHINDVASWCNIDFYDEVSNPLYYAGNLYLGETLITNLVIPEGVTSINAYAFHKCRNIETVTIPNSVMRIGKCAFYNCDGLTEVHINDVASWCNIDFYDEVSNPLYYAGNLYLGETLITNLVIPEGVTNIKANAFYRCKNIKSVTILNSVTSIGEQAFIYCSGLTSVIIGNGVKLIGECAFYACDGLTSVTIGNGVTSIGYSAFDGCFELASVTFEEGSKLTSIGKYAFCACEGLTSITLPNSVTNIDDGAFSCCDSLTTITIPSSVTSIGEAFYYSYDLSEIVFQGTKAEWQMNSSSEYWIYQTSAFVVKCTDGDIYIQV